MARSARCIAERMRNVTARRRSPLTSDSHACHGVDPVDDGSLVTMALEYRTRIVGFVESCSRIGPLGAGGVPARVLQFHSAIYFQTTRAVVGHALAVGGMLARRDEAIACAAQALISVKQSRLALLRFPDGEERRALVALLDRLSERLDRCFPAAREASRSAIQGPKPKD